MPATTPGGWPYVLPADHPVEYPAASQNLANKLEALGLKVAFAKKGSDQTGIASGGGAGFTCTLSNVRIGAPVLGIILHNGACTNAGSLYIAAVWTGLTADYNNGPQLSVAAAAAVQSVYINGGPATAGTVTLTYNITPGAGGTSSVLSRSQFLLVSL